MCVSGAVLMCEMSCCKAVVKGEFLYDQVWRAMAWTEKLQAARAPEVCLQISQLNSNVYCTRMIVRVTACCSQVLAPDLATGEVDPMQMMKENKESELVSVPECHVAASNHPNLHATHTQRL